MIMPKPQEETVVNPRKKLLNLANFKIEALVALLTTGLSLGVLIVANPIGISLLAAVAAAVTVGIVTFIAMFVIKSLFTFLKSKKSAPDLIIENRVLYEEECIQDVALDNNHPSFRFPQDLKQLTTLVDTTSEQAEVNCPISSELQSNTPNALSASKQTFFGAAQQNDSPTQPDLIDEILNKLNSNYNPRDSDPDKLSKYYQVCQTTYQSVEVESMEELIAVLFPRLIAATIHEGKRFYNYCLIALLELDTTLTKTNGFLEYYSSLRDKYFPNTDQNSPAQFLQLIEYKIDSLKETILGKLRVDGSLTPKIKSAVGRWLQVDGNTRLRPTGLSPDFHILLDEYEYLNTKSDTDLVLFKEICRQSTERANTLSRDNDKRDFINDLREGRINSVGDARLREMFPNQNEYEKMHLQCQRLRIVVLSEDEAANVVANHYKRQP
jgi:hypothetical protein